MLAESEADLVMDMPLANNSFFHTLEGWVLFIVALVLLVSFHQLIHRILFGNTLGQAGGAWRPCLRLVS